MLSAGLFPPQSLHAQAAESREREYRRQLEAADFARHVDRFQQEVDRFPGPDKGQYLRRNAQPRALREMD